MNQEPTNTAVSPPPLVLSWFRFVFFCFVLLVNKQGGGRCWEKKKRRERDEQERDERGRGRNGPRRSLSSSHGGCVCGGRLARDHSPPTRPTEPSSVVVEVVGVVVGGGLSEAVKPLCVCVCVL